jgi:hypothetical protein
MKAIIKSILVLSLMIIFGPVTDSFAEALSSQEILEVCDDGLCDDQTLEVKTKDVSTLTGTGRTIKEAKENTLEKCKRAARRYAYDTLKVLADKAKNDGKLKKCAEDCKSYDIHVPLMGDVEFTDKTQFLRSVREYKDIPNFSATYTCTVEAIMTITRICVSVSNQCMEQEKDFAQVQKLLERK